MSVTDSDFPSALGLGNSALTGNQWTTQESNQLKERLAQNWSNLDLNA
jgi:hypothetical protein